MNDEIVGVVEKMRCCLAKSSVSLRDIEQLTLYGDIRVRRALQWMQPRDRARLVMMASDDSVGEMLATWMTSSVYVEALAYLPTIWSRRQIENAPESTMDSLVNFLEQFRRISSTRRMKSLVFAMMNGEVEIRILSLIVLFADMRHPNFSSGFDIFGETRWMTMANCVWKNVVEFPDVCSSVIVHVSEWYEKVMDISFDDSHDSAFALNVSDLILVLMRVALVDIRDRAVEKSKMERGVKRHLFRSW